MLFAFMSFGKPPNIQIMQFFFYDHTYHDQSGIIYGPEYGQPGPINLYGSEYDQPVFVWEGNPGIQFM